MRDLVESRRRLGPPGDRPELGPFLRGLGIGALVGAAIAGSAVVRQRRAGRRQDAHRDTADSGGRQPEA